MAVLFDISFVVLLVGGLDWAVCALRLAIDNGYDNTYENAVPDLLEFGKEPLQLAVYGLVGAADAALIAGALVGYWVRPAKEQNATTLLANVAYVLVLVGGLNWLVCATRLTVDEYGANEYKAVPDAFEWTGEVAQICIYYLVGCADLTLLAAACRGLWVRQEPGAALVSCA